jgi:ribonucleotide monophosphatase NagD (HAD superfamily)
MPDGPWPGTGAVLAAVEAAAGRTADVVVGKPEPGMYEAVRLTLGPGRVLAVGDRLDVDVAGARRAGLDSALVLTGSTSRGAAGAADPAPTHVADSLASLVLGRSF